MKNKTYNLGDAAYIVEHCPFNPTGEDDGQKQWVDMAEDKRERVVFGNLTKAVSFARKVVKVDFWGQVEIWEARLLNPYPEDIPDWKLKPSAREWQKIEGGYECTIER